MKMCMKCEETKPLEEFHKQKRGALGVRSHCKACRVIEGQERYLKNKDRINTTALAWREGNRERWNEYVREYRKKNNSHRTQYNREYRKANPDWYKEQYQKRRALKAGVSVNEEQINVEVALELHGTECLFPGCDKSYEHIDHVIPLSQGGSHDADNLQPLCQKHNNQKFDRYADFRTPPAPIAEHVFWHLFLNNKIWIP